MAIYYLCSGFGMEHSFCNDFGKRLSEDVMKRNSIVYIPASNNTGEILDQVSFFKAQLIEIDMVFPNHIILNSDSMSCDDMKKAFYDTDIVFGETDPMGLNRDTNVNIPSYCGDGCWSETAIKYCPFCASKIEIELIEVQAATDD
jgi:hypothetical protein